MQETKSSFAGTVLFYLSAHIVAAYLFQIARPYINQFLEKHPEMLLYKNKTVVTPVYLTNKTR